jgi:hypothetical protein
MKRFTTGLIAALCLAGAITALVPADALCDLQQDTVIETLVKCQADAR